ncbi:MAG: phytoene desaturase family protein [Capsulimonadaceae bacterium]
MSKSGTIRDRVVRGRYDAVVVGAGPNGLAAGAFLARRGASVLVVEAAGTVGGGCRTQELTLPGLRHDVCAAIHPLGAGSPYLRTLPLEQHGLSWVHPPIPLAHPFDQGPPALLHRSIATTAETLGGGVDAGRYRRLMEALTPDWDALSAALLDPRRLAGYPLGLARFGLPALLPARALSDLSFQGGRAKALFAGMAAHAFLPLDRPLTAAFGLVLAIAGHASGWPMARGGSQAIVDALASLIRSCGGEILTSAPVESLDELPESRVVLCDLGPRQFARIAGERLPAGYRSRLRRFRYGTAAYKVDYALDGPVPWRDPDCVRAGTLHLGPTRADIAAAEAAARAGHASATPFVLVSQQSLFDPERTAGDGHQALWAYCHVPSGYDGDAADAVDAQIERFAPGFRDRILARHVLTPADLEHYNANFVGGDINGGVLDIGQLLARPSLSLVPWATPVRGLYLCSASTPPGGGVHGMCGYYAASIAARDLSS